MSYLLEKAKEKVKKLEEELKGEDLKDLEKDILNAKLTKSKAEVEKYQKLELMDLDKVAADMKIIRNHVKAVDDKYNCKTVKFSYKVADFFDKFSLTKPLAKRIRNYVVTKVNAPVCSILGNEKQDLGEMPSYTDPVELERLEYERKNLEELLKFRNITVNYFENKDKLTFIDKVKFKIIQSLQ